MSRRLIAALGTTAGLAVATTVVVLLTQNSASAGPGNHEPRVGVDDNGLGPIQIIEDRFEVEFDPAPNK